MQQLRTPTNYTTGRRTRTGGSLMQTKLQSAIESGINILIGYLVALASQLVVFPQFGINIPLTDNLLIGFWFTVISLIRSYLVRRYFNKKAAKC